MSFFDTNNRPVIDRRLLRWECDFNANTSSIPTPYWQGAAISSGTLNDAAAGVVNHPGILLLKGAVTTVNSGYRFFTSTLCTTLRGTEETYFIVNMSTVTNITTRFGFSNTTTPAGDPTTGLWIAIANNTLSGKAQESSGGVTTTGTTYTVSDSTWYTLRISVDYNVSRATFYVYNAAGAVLWSDSVTTGLPASTSIMGHGFYTYTTSSDGAARDLMLIDYMSLESTKYLTR